MRGTSQVTKVHVARIYGASRAAPSVVFGATAACALLIVATPAPAQQLPWLAAPPQGAPSAVTVVPKTPRIAAPPMAQPMPPVQPAPVVQPSPVMPVPNAPIAAPAQVASPGPVAPPMQPAPAQFGSVTGTVPGSQYVPEAQPQPVMRPAVVPQAVPAAPAVPGVPSWLWPHVGDGDDQIAATVLKRARDFHENKVRAGATRNPCYFAFDATRPGEGAKRFYAICENSKTFRAVASGHGAGRNFEGLANVTNNARCAKNFSNAANSHLTTGGGYMTAEIRTSFKGYYSDDGGYQPLVRSFVQYTGEGDTANARARAIGGHSAAIVRWQCRLKMPSSKYADRSGYVPYGKLVNYSAGRSSGCTSWPKDADEQFLNIAKSSPTTVYIYPEAKDIVAVGRAVRAGQSPARAGAYWDAACLKEIGAPNFWPREKFEPALAQYAKRHKPGRARTLDDLPLCKTVVGSSR